MKSYQLLVLLAAYMSVPSTALAEPLPESPTASAGMFSGVTDYFSTDSEPKTGLADLGDNPVSCEMGASEQDKQLISRFEQSYAAVLDQEWPRLSKMITAFHTRFNDDIVRRLRVTRRDRSLSSSDKEAIDEVIEQLSGISELDLQDVYYSQETKSKLKQNMLCGLLSMPEHAKEKFMGLQGVNTAIGLTVFSFALSGFHKLGPGIIRSTGIEGEVNLDLVFTISDTNRLKLGIEALVSTGAGVRLAPPPKKPIDVNISHMDSKEGMVDRAFRLTFYFTNPYRYKNPGMSIEDLGGRYQTTSFGLSVFKWVTFRLQMGTKIMRGFAGGAGGLNFISLKPLQNDNDSPWIGMTWKPVFYNVPLSGPLSDTFMNAIGEVVD